MVGDKQPWSVTMRADKDFRTYEQALTVVQRFGELVEADHKRGKHQEAQYNLSHATFVGVKHLLFMAADAAIDRAEARELAAKNHLATVELLSLTLAALGGESGDDEGAQGTRNSEVRRRRAVAGSASSKVPGTKSVRRITPTPAGKRPNTAALRKKREQRERQR
jgi:hypothetical protein